jgi:hypothetical protein
MLPVLKASLVLAMTVSLCVTALAFLVHPAVVKDVEASPEAVATTALKFVMSIGVVTILLGMAGAGVVRATCRGRG